MLLNIIHTATNKLDKSRGTPNPHTRTLGWDDFQKISQIFLGIGETSSVRLKCTMVPSKNLEMNEKVQYKNV